MSLLFESDADRAAPGTHVFLVGVDDYPWIDRLGGDYVTHLPASCRSVTAFHKWLLESYTNHVAPLASIRVLLSPSDEDPNPDVLAAAATATNFLEDCSDWATALSTHRDNVGIFLFSGHGMGLGFDRRIIALHDIGRHEIAPLQGSVSLDNIYAGMAPSERWPEMARTQFYFVDASATPIAVPEYLDRNAAHIFAVRMSLIRDDRSAPLFFSSAPGGDAYSRPNLTIFVESLLRCLDGEGAEPSRGQRESSWIVTSLSLSRALQAQAQDRSAELGLDVRFSMSGLVSNAILHEVEKAPVIPMTITVPKGTPASSIEIVSHDGERILTANIGGEVGGELKIGLRAGAYKATLRGTGEGEEPVERLFVAFPTETKVEL